MVVRDFPHEAAHFFVLGLLPLVYVHPQLLVGLREIIKSLVRQHTGLERRRERGRGGGGGGEGEKSVESSFILYYYLLQVISQFGKFL